MTKVTNLQRALVLATGAALIAAIFLIGLILISDAYGQEEACIHVDRFINETTDEFEVFGKLICPGDK
jgi:hypothetical protein